ncbi:MAG: plasmid stabilization protein [Actinobacteria bacterium]|nr:plasmid stabilization protein [Actinomycetota bacterium]
MADISIRGLDDDVKGKLRRRAAEHGQSMEAEARAILTEAVRDPEDEPDLFETLLERFDALGGISLDLPERQPVKSRVDFS